MSHPSHTPGPQDQPQYTGYGYGGQPIDPTTGQPYWGPPPAPRKSNGLAISSLVLGIVGVLLSWIPLIGYLAFILGLVGFVLGIIGIFKSHRTMSIVGAILSSFAVVFSTIAFASLMNTLDQAADDYNAAVAAVPSAVAPSTPAPELTDPYAEDLPGTDYYPTDEAPVEEYQAPAAPEADTDYTVPELPQLPEVPDYPDTSVSQDNATEKAESYLSWTHFSRSGLIDQLEFEGFTNSEATTAVDGLDVDWNEQAAGSAKSYMSSGSFSRSSLIDQLEFEGFTTTQAQHGADSVGL